MGVLLVQFSRPPFVSVGYFAVCYSLNLVGCYIFAVSYIPSILAVCYICCVLLLQFSRVLYLLCAAIPLNWLCLLWAFDIPQFSRVLYLLCAIPPLNWLCLLWTFEIPSISAVFFICGVLFPQFGCVRYSLSCMLFLQFGCVLYLLRVISLNCVHALCYICCGLFPQF
jgi:hypothetical protein